MKKMFTGASALAISIAVAHGAMAQEPTTVDEVIVTGTRTTGLRAVDSPSPIQVLDDTALSRVGQPDLIQAIAQNIPSFNAQAFGGDTANLTLSAKLRGLSPNHALVLINGKRRHTTSNLAVLGGPFQGGASADLNFIPLASVERIEVLQEGAAAQYGTDAIAGVVNIILKSNYEGGTVIASGGEYIDGGGKTGDIAANIGLKPTEQSWLSLTFESKWHGHSFRGDIDPRLIDTPFNTTSSSRLSAYPQVVNAPNYPYVNRIPGDAEYRLNIFSYNAGYDISDDIKIYTFGTIGMKYAAAFENYRVPNLVVAPNGTLPRPFGFSPKEAIDEVDYGFTAGVKGVTSGWNWDLATTYGKDKAEISVLNSFNRSLFLDTGFSPSTFRAGDFIASQWTTNLDVSHEYEVGMAEPLTLAFGAEYRKDTYEIVAGDPASRYKEGSQSYPGFALTDAGAHDRNSWALYADVAFKPIEALSLDLAIRHENYSDFGDTTVYKGTARYDFNEMFALRGTASTGFRAPTLAESFYSATNVSPTSAFVQLPPNSSAAGLVGINGLKPEKSTNFSVGFVAHPIDRLTATLDVYRIEIEDRIVGSGSLFGSGGAFNIPAVRAAILANGNALDPTVTQTGINIFTNGLDTRTQGAELVLTYNSSFDGWGSVDWSFSANYTDQKVTKILPPPAQLTGASLFDRTSISYLETAAPKFKFVAGALWNVGKFSVNLRETFYGPAKVFQSRTGAVYFENKIGATPITDLEVGFQATEAIKLTVGGNNIFNEYPDKLNPAYRDDFFRANSNGFVTQYPTFSSFGINGGYYYAKASLTF